MKKLNRYVAALALLVLTLSAIFACASLTPERAEEEAFTIDAMQYGGMPGGTVISREKDFSLALLSREDAAAYTGSESDLYEVIKNGLLECRSEIYLSGMGVTMNDLKVAVTDVINTTPALFYVNPTYHLGSLDGYVEYIKPSYKASGDELDAMKKEYEALISEIIGAVEPSWNDFEKTLFIHDYIVRNFEYDYSLAVYDSYTMLKGKKGVCQAYTLLCIDLLSRFDIGVGAVPSAPMSHIWNCVRIDGKWYHMDTTWSDASAPGNHDRFDEISYDNFLCSDSGIAASGHYDWESDLEFSSDYDGHFIKNADHIRISPLGKEWYVLLGGERDDSPAAIICLADLKKGEYEEKFYVADKWYVFGDTGRYYTGTFAGLGYYHDSLVISTSDTLYAYNSESGLVTLGEYSFDDGYIYGLNINGKTATVRIAKNPADFAGDRLEAFDLSEIQFTLEIVYLNKTDPSDPSVYSEIVGWGETFSVVTPEKIGLVTDTPELSGKMPLGGLSTTVFYKSVATLKINYVYADGREAAPSYTDAHFEIGETFSVESPTLGGFRPSISVVSGVMTEDGVEITVTYTEGLYTLKINYLYESGEMALEGVVMSDLEFGYAYDIESPALVGHTPSVDRVLGAIDKDTEINVVYTPISCKIVVSYLYPDQSVIETKEIVLPFGSEYEISSPDIKGYTPESESTVGKVLEELVEISVAYTKNSYTLTVKYIYADGSEAAPSYTETLEFGTKYTVDSPEILHYTPSEFDVRGEISDSDVEISVVYTLTEYTVSFWVNGELFHAIALEYGSKITLPDEIPVMEPTEYKVYIFRCWEGFADGMTVEGSVGFYASFDEFSRKYSVIFKNYDGSVLYETLVEYGKDAEYLGATPTRPSVEGTEYTFVGWDDDTDNITSDKVFNAMFSDGITTYTVSFYDAHGNLIKSEQVYYGQSATPPKDPEKYSDETYEYFFESWDGKYKRVTSDCIVKAKYKKVYIEYTVVFKDLDGNVIFADKLHYGDEITLPTPPEKSSDERYNYVFEKWSPDLSGTVKGNAEYFPVFTAIYKFEYTADEFISAVVEIDSSKSLAERFIALSRAFKMKDSIYLGDEGTTDAIAILDEKIAEYNAEISGINDNFDKANEGSARFFAERVSAIKTVSLAATEVTKRRGAGGRDE